MEETPGIEPATAPAPAPSPDPVQLAQRRHLRRILVSFLVIVVLLPIAGIGGALYWLIVPMLGVATFALREALGLRRSIRESGTVHPTRTP